MVFWDFGARAHATLYERNFRTERAGGGAIQIAKRNGLLMMENLKAVESKYSSLTCFSDSSNARLGPLAVGFMSAVCFMSVVGSFPACVHCADTFHVSLHEHTAPSPV